MHSLYGTNGEMVVSYGLDELWKDVVVVYCNVLFQNVLGQTEEEQHNSSVRAIGLDSDLQYEC